MSLRPSPQPKPFTDWFSLLQFGLGALAISLVWLLAAAGLLGSLLDSLNPSLPGIPLMDSLVPLAGVSILGALLLPSTWFAFRRLTGKPTSEFRFPRTRFFMAILAIPALLELEQLALDAGYGGLVLVLHLLASLLVIGWIVWVAIRGLRPGSAQRAWGAVATGLTATPAIAFVLEAIVGIFLVALLSIYVGLNPTLSHALDSMRNTITNSQIDSIQSLSPFLKDPVILLFAFAGLSIFVPMIEELLKPLGVYLLLGKNLTEAQGFALGALCGAGYGLVENLTLNTDPQTLVLGTIGRFGASAMHILTTALAGYALARAMHAKRFWPLAGTYALNVGLHGLWNGLVLLSTAGVVSQAAGHSLIPAQFVYIGPGLLVAMALGCVLYLFRINRNLFVSTSIQPLQTH